MMAKCLKRLFFSFDDSNKFNTFDGHLDVIEFAPKDMGETSSANNLVPVVNDFVTTENVLKKSHFSPIRRSVWRRPTDKKKQSLKIAYQPSEGVAFDIVLSFGLVSVLDF